MFVTTNLADPDYTYTDDHQLINHISLQLQPAYAIIQRYLQVSQVSLLNIRAMELRVPVTVLEKNFTSVFLQSYTWNEEKQKHIRAGMPYAMSVYLTYENFDFLNS